MRTEDSGGRDEFLCLAYGSNLNRFRIMSRLGPVRKVSVATMPDWRLVERLYADIEPCRGSEVHGIIYRLTAAQMALLDRYEGAPNTYVRFSMDFRFADGEVLPVQIYRMTPAAILDRDGKPYPEPYREICSEGAKQNRIPNAFTRRRTSK